MALREELELVVGYPHSCKVPLSHAAACWKYGSVCSAHVFLP